MAGKHFVHVGGIISVPGDGIVVLQFFTGLDSAQSVDKYTTSFDDGFAVWITPVIDEARVVAVGTGVDDNSTINDEQEGVIVVRGLLSVTPICFSVAHALT